MIAERWRAQNPEQTSPVWSGDNSGISQWKVNTCNAALTLFRVWHEYCMYSNQ